LLSAINAAHPSCLRTGLDMRRLCKGTGTNFPVWRCIAWIDPPAVPARRSPWYGTSASDSTEAGSRLPMSVASHTVCTKSVCSVTGFHSTSCPSELPVASHESRCSCDAEGGPVCPRKLELVDPSPPARMHTKSPERPFRSTSPEILARLRSYPAVGFMPCGGLGTFTGD